MVNHILNTLKQKMDIINTIKSINNLIFSILIYIIVRVVGEFGPGEISEKSKKDKYMIKWIWFK